MKKYLLWIILSLGLILRLLNLDALGIWEDEKYSLLNSIGISETTTISKHVFSSADIWKNNTLENIQKANIIDDGSNAFFYTSLLHFWIQLFGTSDFAIRLMSVLFGVLIIYLIYKLSLKIYQSERAALFAAVIAAIHPLLIRYSQEARSYSLGILLSLFASYCLFEFITNRKNKTLVAYSVCIILSLFTHFYTLYVFGAHFIFMIYLQYKGEKHLRYFLVFTTSFMVFMVLWYLNKGIEGITQIAARDEQIRIMSLSPNPDVFPATFLNVITGIFQILLPMFGNMLQNIGLRIREISILLIIPLIIILPHFKQYLSGNKFLILITIALLIIFLSVSAIIAGHTSSFLPQYSVFCVPFVILLLAGSLASYSKLSKWVIITMFINVIIFSISIYSIYTDSARQIKNKERIFNPYISLTNKIKDQYEKGDTIVYHNNSVAIVSNLYLKSRTDIVQVLDESKPSSKVELKKEGNSVLLFDFQDRKYSY